MKSNPATYIFLTTLNESTKDCCNHNMCKASVTGGIYAKELEFLEQHPKGLHWSELAAKIKGSDPNFHPKTVNGCI
jgi:hypothetical protein